MDQLTNFLKYFWSGSTRGALVFFAATSIFSIIVIPWDQTKLWVFLCLGLSVLITVVNVVKFFKYKNFNRRW